MANPISKVPTSRNNHYGYLGEVVTAFGEYKLLTQYT